MRKTSFLACLLMGALTASVANAGVLSLSLDAGLTDLNALTVGAPVTIDVVIDGLMPGQSLVSLSATVETPAEFSLDLGSLAAGDVFSGGVEASDLILSTPFDDADAIFIQFDGLPIFTNGVFFSFDYTATSIGSGNILFGPFTPTAEVDDGGGFPTFVEPEINSLAFTVSGGSKVVPEPSSLLCFGLLGLMTLVQRGRKS